MIQGDTRPEETQKAMQAQMRMSIFNPNGKTAVKNSIVAAAIVAFALSAPIASAQEMLTSAKPDMPALAKPAMNMDMEDHMSQMQEKMKAMQAQMDTIHSTTDANERQALMQAHMLAMQENMKAMHGMSGPMMKGGGEPGGIMFGPIKSDMAGGSTMKHHEMIEKRMGMMQMMMEQMMRHDQAMEPMPSR